jgi:hypothetical protein
VTSAVWLALSAILLLGLAERFYASGAALVGEPEPGRAGGGRPAERA